MVSRHNRTVVHTVGQTGDRAAVLGINITLAFGGWREGVVIERNVNESIIKLTTGRG